MLVAPRRVLTMTILNQGSTALVTGGSGGIGSAVVQMLAHHGVSVIALSDDADGLDALQVSGPIEKILLDVTDAAAMRSTFSERSVDILVSAAGVLGVTGTLFDVPAASSQRILDVNVMGTHNALSAVVPGMIRRNRGHVINIGSIAGPYPSTGQPMYSASKAAVHNMSANLRMELFGTDIRVTELRPGRVRTGMHAEMFGGDRAKANEQLYDPYECLKADDIAEVIRFVLTMPPHACVAQIEVVPTHQVVGGTKMFQRT
jgi:3-hydroxy acid dehydrogenase/malonic semialdehyde reductase